jgi:hypothetical protein
MKVRVTSIAWEEVGELVRSVGVAMEVALTDEFQHLTFGAEIDQLTIIVISLSSDVDENARVSKGYNKIKRFRHPFNGEQMRTIGFAVPIDPDILVKMTSSDLKEMICAQSPTSSHSLIPAFQKTSPTPCSRGTWGRPSRAIVWYRTARS